LTDAVGQLLRKHRAELAAVEADRQARQIRQQEISAVQLEMFDVEEQQAGLRDLDAQVQKFIASLPAGTAVKPDDLQSLLKTKRRFLNNLAKDLNSYYNDLLNVDFVQGRLVQEADSYRREIDEKVLWIRSARRLTVGDFAASGGAIGWLFSPSHWLAAAKSLLTGVQNNPLVSLLVGALVAGWLLIQRRLRVFIRHLAYPHRVAGKTVAGPLKRAVLVGIATMLIAIGWPTAFWLVGSAIVDGSVAGDEFTRAIGLALQTTAGVLLPLLAVRQMCRREGLAESHFGWPGEALHSLRRHLAWLALAGAPVVLCIATLESQTNDLWKNSLGRLLLVAGQLLLATWVWAVLRGPHGALHQLLIRHDGWPRRMATPIFAAVFALPLLLAALAIAGYEYTALRLVARLENTVWLLLAIVVVQAVLSRWLTAVYRRLAIKAAVHRAGLVTFTGTAAAENTVALFNASAGTTAQQADDAPPEIDLEKVDAQTHRLLHSTAVVGVVVGLWLIWSDVLPALQFLNQIALWPDSTVDGGHVTLADAVDALIVLCMTVLAATNLPNLLEIALFERLPMDRGVRYALATVVRYLIAVAGLTLAGGAIGIGWPKMQWLAAAISFGLGFGLQEIFANFVSGLIVLFERPIRIGDTVTVGEVTGVVSRIQMRATTILDADRKELIVPNKEFITSRLVNWTLSDSVIRLVLKIGISYGSDTRQAQRILMRVAGETADVLHMPPPSAVFMGFGEKGIDFELRVFVGNVDALLSVRHRLNSAIEQAFRGSPVEFAAAPHDVVQHVAIDQVIGVTPDQQAA
jgi:potassium efflux system protein